MNPLRRALSTVFLLQMFTLGSGLNGGGVVQKTPCTINCVGSSCTGCVSNGNGVWYCGQVSSSDAAHFCD